MRLTAAAALALSALLVACGGGGSNDPEPTSVATSTPAVTEEAVASTPATQVDAKQLMDAALARMATVGALSSTFDLLAVSENARVNVSGDYTLDGAGNGHGTVQFPDELIELLVVPPNVYLKRPSEDWRQVPDDQRANFEDLVEGSTFKEFEELLRLLADVQIINETGTRYELNGTFDLQTYLDSLAPDDPDRAQLEQATLTGPATVTLAIDKESKFVSAIAMRIDFSVQGSDVTTEVYATYNELADAPVFPPEPVDAPLLEAP